MSPLLLLLAATHAAEVPVARATGRIVLDGRLDEPDWAAAPPITGFQTWNPEVGQPAPEPTARVLVDDAALYVAFEVASGDRELVHAVVPRDDTLTHDWVEVLLDTYQDGQRAFGFRVNPDGVQSDGIYQESSGDSYDHDHSWDGDWEAETTRTASGYTVELRIPWRTLRYGGPFEQRWGIVLQHYTPIPWTLSTWPAMSREATGFLSQAATLGPFTAPPARLPVELQTTLTIGFDALGPYTPGLLLIDERANPGMDPGLNAKIGLSSSLTLDLALNPDFSQIESDADQVTANIKLPLYYEEKRPFFLESADLFDTGIEAFYSRSVADPLGGARLTGRAGPVGVGLVSAWDERPAASTIGVDYATGEALPTWSEADVAGAGALVNVARARWNPGGGDALGGLYSDKELFRPDGAAWANRVAGLDGRAELGGQYLLAGQALVSQTDFADGGRLGYAGHLAGVRSGDLLFVGLESTVISRDFRAENGFIPEVDRVTAMADAQLFLENTKRIRGWYPELTVTGTWDLDGALTWGEINPYAQILPSDRLYLLISAPVQRERVLGQDFDLWSADGILTWAPSANTNVSAGWDIGPQPHYDAQTAEDLYLGFSYLGELNLSARLFGRVAVEWIPTTQQFLRSATGPVVYSTVLNRATVNVNWTRAFATRLIAEHNSFQQSLDSSLLFAWEYRYGTAVYLGCSESRDLEADELVSREVFAKSAWMWRP